MLIPCHDSAIVLKIAGDAKKVMMKNGENAGSSTNEAVRPTRGEALQKMAFYCNDD